MDKFVENAFKGLEQREVDAFAAIDKKTKFSLHLAATLFVGAEKMARLIMLAKDNGSEGTLHAYAEAMFMAGFKEGYKAGKESLM